MTKPRNTTESSGPALEPWQEELLAQAGELIVAGRLVKAPGNRTPTDLATCEPATKTEPTERGE